MKNLLLALTILLPLSAHAVEIWEGESAEINCDPPTAYMDGMPIRVDDTLRYNLYLEGDPVAVQTDQTACSFIVQPPAGEYIYRATAISAFYGTESLPAANTAEVVVNVKKRPMAPADMTVRVLPQ